MTCSPDGSGDTFISSFLTAVRADLDSPITSNFGSRISEYRVQAQRIAEEVDGDIAHFDRMRRISKEVENVLVSLSKQLLALGGATKELAEKWAARGAEADSDGAAALMKMEFFLRAESGLINDQVRNWSNNMLHPLDLLLSAPSELKSKGVDKACRDYEAKFVKVESETKKHAKQSGYSRSQVTHRELAVELTNERLSVEYELCKFLHGLGSIEDKKSSQLVRHFLELFRSQHEYCTERLKINEHLRRDFETLEKRMATRCASSCQQRNALLDVKTRLENDHGILRLGISRRGRTESSNRGSRLSVVEMYGGTSSSSIGLGSITGVENETLQDMFSSGFHSPNDSVLLAGYLYKKSNKKLHKQWQKRRCKIQDGCFLLSHCDESIAPAKLNLLVSDCKPSSEGSRMFDLYCRDRTYHLQAETEAEAKRWIIALKQEILRLKTELLNTESGNGETSVSGGTGREWGEWKKCVSAVRNLPGNHECADCSSSNEVQWLSNTGALVCIDCSGVHRELGVHVSRIQSLDLDIMSPVEFLIPLTTGNIIINHIYEGDEKPCNLWKPRSGCSRTDRQNFIQQKYREKSFVKKIEDADGLFLEAMKELNVEKAYKALLSPNVTFAPFVEHGPFSEMIRQNNPLALPIVQLVVQLGIAVPAIESLLRECVQSGNIDALCVLLYSRFGSGRHDAASLKPLESLAHELGFTEIAEVLRIAQTSSRGQLSQITIPSSLIVSTSSSGSLSQSSSSISPLTRPSPEIAAEPSLSPVNVLMRNGTTIAVSRDNNPSQRGAQIVSPAVQRRSVSSAEARSRPSSARIYSCSTYPLSTSVSSFKGTTFGKSLNGTLQQRASHCLLEQPTSKQSTNVCLDLNHVQSSHMSGSAHNISTGTGQLNLSSNSSSTSPKIIPSSEESSIKSANSGILTQPVPQQTGLNIARPTTHIPAAPNFYSKAPGSLKLSSKTNRFTAVDKDPVFASSVPSSPVPALPTQPKPKMYHRSASEYSQPVPNVGVLRELHEQKLSSVALKNNCPYGSSNDRSSKLAVGMSTSFSTASSSMSLDPIPLVQTGRKDDKCSSNLLKERSSEKDRNNQHHGQTQIAEWGDVTCEGILTSFDSARASFMTPGERARFSTINPTVRSDIVYVPEFKKSILSNSPPTEVAPTLPKGSGNIASSTSVKLKPPIPTPRRSMGVGEGQQREIVRRCRALYDCVADNPDELSFKQGDVIIISKERIAGENDTWMEGYLANDPQRRGVFPITFVTFQS